MTLSVISWVVGGIIAPQASLLGTIAAPFEKAATALSNAVKDGRRKAQNNETLIMENTKLQEQINELNKQVADYAKLQSQNEFYKNYLEIKDIHPDYKFADAVIISKDTTDVYGGFTVDKGSLNGISKYDPVITDAGLVGYISEVGTSTSKVVTVLSSNLSVGTVSVRTGDSGSVCGTLDLAGRGLTKMSNLQRSSSVAIGDYLVTSGGGVFPNGILIGKISNISQETHTTNLYAVVTPFVDLSAIRQVMIITDFTGKTDISLSEGE